MQETARRSTVHSTTARCKVSHSIPAAGDKRKARSRAKAASLDDRLCVISGGMNYLSYGDWGDPKINFRIRTYSPGKLDSRIACCRLLKSVKAVARYLIGEKDAPVIASVAHVKEATGMTERKFAPVLDD